MRLILKLLSQLLEKKSPEFEVMPYGKNETFVLYELVSQSETKEKYNH